MGFAPAAVRQLDLNNRNVRLVVHFAEYRMFAPADMDGLFKPPPFGGPAARPTVLAAAAMPENVPIWDLFRNIGEASETS